MRPERGHGQKVIRDGNLDVRPLMPIRIADQRLYCPELFLVREATSAYLSLDPSVRQPTRARPLSVMVHAKPRRAIILISSRDRRASAVG